MTTKQAYSRIWILKTSQFQFEKRRFDICLKFGLKTVKNNNHIKWFKPNQNGNWNLRRKLPKYKTPFCRTKRFYNSTIPYLTRIINEKEK